MDYRGDLAPGTIVRVKFPTHTAAGAPATLAGTPAASVYKDGSTTQSTTGITLTVDFDGVVGLHQVAIDTAADAAFYAAGSDFEIVLTAGTVDGVSVVGSVVGSFSLRARPAWLHSAGLDGVVVEAGLNARQALALVAAAAVGDVEVDEAGNTITLSGAGVATSRIVVTPGALGIERTSTLTPPA